jgi:SPP1 family predicted phage head-tail adaptor
MARMRRPRFGRRSVAGVGQMTERITIEGMSETPDGYGGSTRTWATVLEAWAAVEVLSATEQGERGGERGVTSAQVTLYRTTVVGSEHRLVWDGRNWDITGVLRGPAHEPFMTLEVEHVAGRGGA